MEWISIEDRLPDYEKHVLFFCEDREDFKDEKLMFVGYRKKLYLERKGKIVREWEEFVNAYYIDSVEDVTHWMDLPECPIKD